MIKENSTVLFQGDSITDVKRNRDDEASLGGGYPLLVAARMSYECPKAGIKYINRGISGNRVVDLYARWREDALNLRPDYISILIGVNDVGHEFSKGRGVEAGKYERVYGMLLEETAQALPDAKIIICEPFILPAGVPAQNFQDWEREIKLRREAAQRLAERHGCIFVPLQRELDKAAEAAPPEHWLYDGVHPTPAGHELIARRWIGTVLSGDS